MSDQVEPGDVESLARSFAALWDAAYESTDSQAAGALVLLMDLVARQAEQIDTLRAHLHHDRKPSHSQNLSIRQPDLGIEPFTPTSSPRLPRAHARAAAMLARAHRARTRAQIARQFAELIIRLL